MSIKEIIKNAMIIWIAYCIKAIMSPTCICEFSILWLPVQMIKTEIKFIKSIMDGIIITMALFIKRSVCVNFLFASSNLFSSKLCAPKALITRIPLKFSFVTKLNISTSFWTRLNFGNIIMKTLTIRTTKINIPRRIVQYIETLLLKAIIIPPRASIGA